MRRIRIIYQQGVDDIAKNVTRRTITETFLLDFLEEEEDLPIWSAYDRVRGQFDADKIMSIVLSRYSCRPILTIVPYDLYAEGLNFVFGVALVGKGAVIGLERFRYGGGDFRDRLAKTIKHELGHVFGLGHCRNPCVMRFANSLYELDQKPGDFCILCRKKLSGIVR